MPKVLAFLDSVLEFPPLSLRSCTQRKHTKRKSVTTWTSHNVQRHNTYSATKHEVHYIIVTKHFVTVYILWRCTLCDVYVLKLLRCVQLRFVTLRHVTFTLCCFTLCSNIYGNVFSLWELVKGSVDVKGVRFSTTSCMTMNVQGFIHYTASSGDMQVVSLSITSSMYSYGVRFSTATP